VGRPVCVLFSIPSLILFSALSVNAGEPVCATRPDQLSANSELMRLKDYFPEHIRAGYVNETAGSYFEVVASAPAADGIELHPSYVLTFYTSGFLDLYGVMRTGPAKFCFENGELNVHSMGQIQKIQIQAGRLLLGEGGPRKSFARGSMPPKLVKLHRPPGSSGSRSSEKGFANPSQREEY
jgi:hypothetical protein